MQSEKIVTGENAAKSVGSVAVASTRVQSDLAEKLERRRNRIISGEDSVKRVGSQAEAKEQVVSELAMKLQKQQSKISNASELSAEPSAEDVEPTGDERAHQQPQASQDASAMSGIAEHAAPQELEEPEESSLMDMQESQPDHPAGRPEDSSLIDTQKSQPDHAPGRPLAAASNKEVTNSSRLWLSFFIALIAVLVALWIAQVYR